MLLYGLKHPDAVCTMLCLFCNRVTASGYGFCLGWFVHSVFANCSCWQLTQKEVCYIYWNISTLFNFSYYYFRQVVFLLLYLVFYTILPLSLLSKHVKILITQSLIGSTNNRSRCHKNILSHRFLGLRRRQVTIRTRIACYRKTNKLLSRVASSIT